MALRPKEGMFFSSFYVVCEWLILETSWFKISLSETVFFLLLFSFPATWLDPDHPIPSFYNQRDTRLFIKPHSDLGDAATTRYPRPFEKKKFSP